MANKIKQTAKENTLYQIIHESATEALKMQDASGAFPGGHNGVRFDPETPVRNTGHWLITMLKVYSFTEDEKFRESAVKATEYLLSREARPMNASFWHRMKPEKDFCNGLMGQAYTIESLATAYRILGNEEALKAAEEVFLMHPFDEKTGLWCRVAVDGSYLKVDATFNHELWFAAAGAVLFDCGGNQEIGRRVSLFTDNLSKNVMLYPFAHRGLVVHLSRRNLSDDNTLQKKISKTVKLLRQAGRKRVKLATGYHAFNLYALSMLKQVYPSHPFWTTRKLNRMLDYIQSSGYVNTSEAAAFSDPYSPAGFGVAYFERAFTLQTFYPEGEKQAEIQDLVSKQLQKSYNWETRMLDQATSDALTQSARLYEATRLLDVTISVDQ